MGTNGRNVAFRHCGDMFRYMLHLPKNGRHTTKSPQMKAFRRVPVTPSCTQCCLPSWPRPRENHSITGRPKSVVPGGPTLSTIHGSGPAVAPLLLGGRPAWRAGFARFVVRAACRPRSVGLGQPAFMALAACFLLSIALRFASDSRCFRSRSSAAFHSSSRIAGEMPPGVACTGGAA